MGIMTSLRHPTAFVCFLAIFLNGCFLFNSSKKSGRSAAPSKLIVLNQVLIDRTPPGRDKALVRFKTTSPAFCELKYWSQDPSVSPQREFAKVSTCANKEGKSGFEELISDLNPNVLYYVEIGVWLTNQTKDQAERTTFKETSGGGNAQGTPSSPTAQGDGKFADVMVARMSVPQASVEVHRHAFAEPVDIGTLKNPIILKPGCALGNYGQAIYPDADSNLRIQNLGTTGFARANAQLHPDYQNRMRLVYGSMQFGDQWQWAYQLDGQNHQFLSKAAGNLASLSLKARETLTFPDPQLETIENSVAIDPDKPLEFNWKADNLTENSYLTVQIGRSGNAKSLYCVFDAAKGVGTIEASLIQGLEPSTYVLLAQLETYQVQAFPGTPKPTWIIATYDWRSTRIEKK